MTTLRSWVDGQISVNAVAKETPALKVKDQVILKRKSGLTSKATQEIMCGTIVRLTEGGMAEVTMPRPGGRILRSIVPVNRLTPASSVYKRTQVNVNPAFRQVYTNKV